MPHSYAQWKCKTFTRLTILDARSIRYDLRHRRRLSRDTFGQLCPVCAPPRLTAGSSPRLSGLIVMSRAGPVDGRVCGKNSTQRARRGAKLTKVGWTLRAVPRGAGKEIFLANFALLRALCVELCDPSGRSNGGKAAATGLLAIPLGLVGRPYDGKIKPDSRRRVPAMMAERPSPTRCHPFKPVT